MKRSLTLIAVGLAVTLPACISTDVSRMSRNQYASVPDSDVQVYLYADDVPQSCERLAMIETSGSTSMTNEAQMIRRGRREAGKIGGNAVVIDRIKEPSGGAQVAAAVFGLSTSRKGRMVALRCPQSAMTPVQN